MDLNLTKKINQPKIETSFMHRGHSKRGVPLTLYFSSKIAILFKFPLHCFQKKKIFCWPACIIDSIIVSHLSLALQ